MNKKSLALIIIFGGIASVQLAFSGPLSPAKDVVFTVDYNVSREQAYKLSKLWIVDNFSSAKDVITFDDEELGIITGRFNFKGFMGSTYWGNFKINLDSKTITFNNFSVNGKSVLEGGMNNIMKYIEGFAESYRKALIP